MPKRNPITSERMWSKLMIEARESCGRQGGMTVLCINFTGDQITDMELGSSLFAGKRVWRREGLRALRALRALKALKALMALKC